MNDQQVLGLLLACAVVMIPLGAALGSLWRWGVSRIERALPPRHLKPVGQVRVRRHG